jgi:hypothetical protein
MSEPMSQLHGFLPLLGLGLLAAALLDGQTTQGIVSGRVVDSVSGRPIAAAGVSFERGGAGANGSATADGSGYFTLPLLSPGLYNLRVSSPQYQPQELQGVELAVAGRLDFQFRLRPLTDVWEAGTYRSVLLPNSETVVTFYGPDLDTSRSGSFDATRGSAVALESAISQVIDGELLRGLPLNGRDVYTLLVTQPGVTADTSTSRGLGLAVDGQRPSASNFLVDGLENNNYLITGPLSRLAPEAVEEYRISTGTFSAEYGRTPGFLANAITRSGGNAWHGLGYFYLKNDVLNANGFQENLAGVRRTPVRELQPGWFVGGPIRANRLFVSLAFEHYRFRSQQDPQQVKLPSAAFLARYTQPNSDAARILKLYPAPAVSNGIQPTGILTLSPPVSDNRLLALPRIDYLRHDGAERFALRLAVAREEQPDFMWSPYPDFISPLHDNTLSLGATWLRNLRANLTNELRFAANADDLRFDRAHPEVPALSSGDGTTLPGSPAFYGYRNHGHSEEVVDNILWARGRHIFKFGGNILPRQVGGYLTAGRDGYYNFNSVIDFGADSPSAFYATVERDRLPQQITPQYDRSYRYTQFAGFFEDSFKVSQRLVVNGGVRYENSGAPVNVGSVKDLLVQLGGGNSIGARIAGASLAARGGNEQLYPSDNRDFGVRAGFSYGLTRDGRMLLRGGYGIYYDRPFENLWQTLRNNNNSLGIAGLRGRFDFLEPVQQVLGSVRLTENPALDSVTLFQPGLRSAYVHNVFVGLQREVADRVVVELNGIGAFGRKLLTTDAVNRPLSIPSNSAAPNNPLDAFNGALPILSYRANQGISNYYGFTAVARYRGRSSQFQVSYTLSHAIDTQSDPLVGDFYNLSFTQITSGQDLGQRSAFVHQFDSHGARANSDFDQRQNLVFYGLWRLPSPRRGAAAIVARNWSFGAIGALRSGFPYSPSTPFLFDPTGEWIYNNTPNLIDPAHAVIDSPATGGKRLLNAAAFGMPAPGHAGNVGRNEFRGPGLYNLDISLSRGFGLKWLGDAGRITARADVFNLLNHANLNNPDPLFSPDNPNFGIASYGRVGRPSGFPGVAPLNETARQVQFMVQVSF